MSLIESKLDEMGILVPDTPVPAGSYLPYRICGNILYLSGMLCFRDGELTHTGPVGEDQTVESGYEAARISAINSLAAIRSALGEFDRVVQFLHVNGYVNAVPGFTESPNVINGASNLFAELYGKIGKHSRAVVSVSGLPLNSTVEIQVTASFR